MTRLLTTGFEIQAGDATTTQTPDGSPGTALATYSSTKKRSGGFAVQCDSGGAASPGYIEVYEAGTTVNDRPYYCRAYFLFDSLPGATTQIMQRGAGVSGFSIRLTSAGKLQLFSDTTGTQIGSDSAGTIVADGTTWYKVALMTQINTAGNDTIEAQLNDVSFASSSGSSLTSTSQTWWDLGWVAGPGGNNLIVYVDDVAINDDQGSAQNTWPGNGKVILMKPTSDTQRGSWTGGSGGTTNLWEAINNTPPIGSASEDNTTQIENADTTPDNATDEYRGDCGSYTTAGIAAADTIDVIHAVINHGEDVGTNTKTGSFGGQSNPSWTYDTFTFGNDIGALGSWSINWRWQRGTAQVAPSVTKGSSLILAVRKTDTGNRVGSVDFYGAYVEYTPGGGAPPPDRLERRMMPLLVR